MQWTRRGPDEAKLVTISDGDRLRIEIGRTVMVRLGVDAGFTNSNGETRDLTTAERERLRRELACNPMLWPRAEIPARMKGCGLTSST